MIYFLGILDLDNSSQLLVSYSDKASACIEVMPKV
jgi:hypothetical protein